jgi:hypothetical protein
MIRKFMQGGDVYNNIKHLVKNANEQVVVNPNTYAGTAKYIKNIIRYLAFNNTLISKNLATQKGGIGAKDTQFKYTGNTAFVDSASAFSNANQQEARFIEYSLQPNYYDVKEVWDFTTLRNTFLNQIKHMDGALQRRFLQDAGMSAMLDAKLEDIPLMNDALYIKGKTNVIGANGNAPMALFANAYTGFNGTLEAGNGYKLRSPSVAISGLNISGTYLLITVAGSSIKKGDYIIVKGIGNGAGNMGTQLNGREYTKTTDKVSPRDAVGIIAQDVTVSGANQIIETNIKVVDLVGAVLDTPNFTNARLHFVNTTNVIDFLASAWIAIPEALREREDFNFWVHPGVKNALALSDADRVGSSYIQYEKTKFLNFVDKNLVSVPNMTPASLIGICQENAEIGVDDSADESSIVMIDTLFTTGDKFQKLVMSMGTCVGVPKTEESIYIRP